MLDLGLKPQATRAPSRLKPAGLRALARVATAGRGRGGFTVCDSMQLSNYENDGSIKFSNDP